MLVQWKGREVEVDGGSTVYTDTCEPLSDDEQAEFFGDRQDAIDYERERFEAMGRYDRSKG